jgi:hypothetical protein
MLDTLDPSPIKGALIGTQGLLLGELGVFKGPTTLACLLNESITLLLKVEFVCTHVLDLNAVSRNACVASSFFLFLTPSGLFLKERLLPLSMLLCLPHLFLSLFPLTFLFLLLHYSELFLRILLLPLFINLLLHPPALHLFTHLLLLLFLDYALLLPPLSLLFRLKV